LLRQVFEGWNVTILLGALWASLCWALFLNKAELWLVLAGFVGFSLLCLLLDATLPAFKVAANRAIFISACASAAYVTTMLAGSGKVYHITMALSLHESSNSLDQIFLHVYRDVIDHCSLRSPISSTTEPGMRILDF